MSSVCVCVCVCVCERERERERGGEEGGREGGRETRTHSNPTVSQFIVQKFPQPGRNTGEIPREVGELP